jgi:hypothetical protein
MGGPSIADGKPCTRPGRRPTARLTALAVCGAVAVSGFGASSAAAADAETKVTIRNEGRDLYGYVKSERKRCMKDRKVKVFRKSQGEKEKIGTDTAEKSNGKYRWELGNTGLKGRFYAKVGEIPGCEKDKSPTIRVN